MNTTKPPVAGRCVLPREARLAINRCNLPAAILGSLTFQRHPAPLVLDGVAELHAQLFRDLDAEADPGARAELFRRHLAAAFNLGRPEEAGLTAGAALDRSRADYLRMLRGWFFDSEGVEGAALKGWVESRFGLLTRHHGGPIRDFAGEPYRRFLEMRSRGLYGGNALEAQFDLVYAWCQHELARRHPGASHLTLYRGVNRMGGHELLGTSDADRCVLLNNLSSFTASRERADEFGDAVLEVRAPLAKVFFFHGLLPGSFQGEEEYLLIGGVYEVRAAIAPRPRP